MDKHELKASDAITEDEVRSGFRIKQLPRVLQAVLKADGLPVFTTIRLTRINPRKSRRKAELTQAQYHQDLKNDSLLSNEQLLKLNEARGEWDAEKEKQLKTLQEACAKAMGQLYIDGVGDADAWITELKDEVSSFLATLAASEKPAEEQAALKERFERWLAYNPDRKAEYTTLYAETLGIPEYNSDHDYVRLLEAGLGIDTIDTIGHIDALNERLYRVTQLVKDQEALDQLRDRRLKIFADSVESRRDNTIEMAQLYVTCERWVGGPADEGGKSDGPVTATFDALYDIPFEVLNWLIVQSYLFQNNMADAAQDYLQKFGFMTADPEQPVPSGDSGPSAASPEVPSSSPATLPVATTDSASSVSLPVTT